MSYQRPALNLKRFCVQVDVTHHRHSIVPLRSQIQQSQTVYHQTYQRNSKLSGFKKFSITVFTKH